MTEDELGVTLEEELRMTEEEFGTTLLLDSSTPAEPTLGMTLSLEEEPSLGMTLEEEPRMTFSLEEEPSLKMTLLLDSAGSVGEPVELSSPQA